jgi:hypothetical protein
LAKHTLDTLLSLASTTLLPSRGHWKMDMPGQHGPGNHTEDTCYSCYTVTTEAFSSFPESFSKLAHKSNMNAKTQEIHIQMRFST